MKYLIRKVLREQYEITKQASELKSKYISQFGKEKFNELVSNLISGNIPKEEFISNLRSAGGDTNHMGNFITKFGIKFSKDEIDQIKKIAPQIKKMVQDEVLEINVNTIKGEKNIRIIALSEDAVAKFMTGFRNATMMFLPKYNSIVVITDYIGGLSIDDLSDILTHEIAHIKDPSLTKSPKYKKMYVDKAEKGLKDTVEVNKILDTTGPSLKTFDLERSAIINYYLNPNEIIANNSMFLQRFAINTEKLMNKKGKEWVIDGLDQIIKVARLKSIDIDKLKRNAKTLLGLYTDHKMFTHLYNLIYKPSENRKFWTKLAQQSEYLKSQVKLSHS